MGEKISRESLLQSRVGYKMPPQATRFQKGVSGNPSGRPRGSRSLAKIVEQELAEKITVKQGRRRRTITKREALGRDLVARAIAGDPRAVDRVIQLSEIAEENAIAEAEQKNSENGPTLGEVIREIYGLTPGNTTVPGHYGHTPKLVLGDKGPIPPSDGKN